MEAENLEFQKEFLYCFVYQVEQSMVTYLI